MDNSEKLGWECAMCGPNGICFVWLQIMKEKIVEHAKLNGRKYAHVRQCFLILWDDVDCHSCTIVPPASIVLKDLIIIVCTRGVESNHAAHNQGFVRWIGACVGGRNKRAFVLLLLSA